MPQSGKTVLLIFHHSILSPNLNHNLLITIQMILHDVIVNETPKFQSLNPTNLSHSIRVRCENVDDVLVIPSGITWRGVMLTNFQTHTSGVWDLWQCYTTPTHATPAARAHGRTDKSKRPESHPTKECTRACVICLKTEPKYYYCPITLVMTCLIALV
jgi:hypothetical protein